ncbi:hypothetical protein M3676_15640 [Metabacillus litoralis]|nr:hypothetical protein [Metabacillus litoralis]
MEGYEMEVIDKDINFKSVKNADDIIEEIRLSLPATFFYKIIPIEENKLKNLFGTGKK